MVMVSSHWDIAAELLQGGRARRASIKVTFTQQAWGPIGGYTFLVRGRSVDVDPMVVEYNRETHDDTPSASPRALGDVDWDRDVLPRRTRAARTPPPSDEGVAFFEALPYAFGVVDAAFSEEADLGVFDCGSSEDGDAERSDSDAEAALAPLDPGAMASSASASPEPASAAAASSASASSASASELRDVPADRVLRDLRHIAVLETLFASMPPTYVVNPRWELISPYGVRLGKIR